MNISPNQEILAFVTVVDFGSFAGASRQLSLTASATSKLVSRLEGRLGVRLLHRTTRKVSLTQAGEQYYQRVRPALLMLSDAETEIAEQLSRPSGKLQISTSIGFSIHYLAPKLAKFTDRYPDVEISIGATDRLVDPVKEQADVTIRTGTLEDSDLTSLHLRTYDRIVCAAPAYLAKAGMPEQPNDLLEHTVISYAPPRGHSWPFVVKGQKIDVEAPSRVTTDSSDTALHLAIEGVGIARIMDAMTERAIRQGKLVPLLEAYAYKDAVPISALYLPGSARLPKIRVFLQFLVQEFGTRPWLGTIPLGGTSPDGRG